MANGQAPGEPKPPDINEVAESIVGQFGSAVFIERWSRGMGAAAVETLQITIGALIGMAAWIGAELARALASAETYADGAYKRLLETAIFDITGENVSIGGARPGERGARTGAHRSVGAAMMNVISGGTFRAGGNTQMAPSLQPAEKMVETLTTMAMEGWLSDVIGELVTLGAVEQLGDLDDRLSQSLGLARLARVGLRPVVEVTIATPAEWQVHKTYRPKLLAVGEAVRQFARGRWSREQLFEELARQGWSDDRIEAHINAQRKFLTPGELVDAINLGLQTYESATQHLQDAGYDFDTANLRMRLQIAQDILTEKEAIGSAAVTAYAGRQIDQAEFEGVLNAAAIEGPQRVRFRMVGEARRAMNRRELSEGDAREAVERGILSVPDYRRVLERLGYDEQAIDVKELLLIADLKGAADAKKEKERLARERAEAKTKREADAAKRRAELEAERAVTEPTIAQALALTVRGIFSFEQYAQWLAFYRYDPATIAALVDEAEQKRADYLDAQAQRDAARVRASRRPVSWATLESAVMRGVLSIDTYRRRLLEEKVTPEDADIIIATLEDRIREQRELEAERERLKTQQPEKELSLAQAEEAVLRGLGSVDDFDAYLQGARYSDFARTVLVELMRRRLAERDAALERRAEQEAAAAARRVPLAEIRRAVLKGVRDRRDYETALVNARIDAEDRVLFLDVLDAEIAELARARQTRAEAERRRAARGLSLEQLERAVILGALPVARYQQALLDDGWSAGDVDVLTALLLERVQLYARARVQREQLDALEAFTGLTIGELARAVRKGVRAMSDYALALELKGLGEEDIATLVELLQLEIDADAETAAETDQGGNG